MSEEQETNDSTWSGLKKTIIGTIATAVTAGGAWFTSTLFGGGDDEEKPKTEQAPAAAPVAAAPAATPAAAPVAKK